MGKRYLESAKLVEKNKKYEINEALEIIEKMPKAKFDETVMFNKNTALCEHESGSIGCDTCPVPEG